jgi:hypothetical protein
MDSAVDPYIQVNITSNQTLVTEISQSIIPPNPSAYLAIVNPKGSALFSSSSTDLTGVSLVSLLSTWIQYNDTTFFPSVASGSGFSSSFVSSQIGSQTTADLNFAPLEVRLFFSISRGTTYTAVERSYQVSLGVLIGSILGYFSTLIAVFAMVGKLIEGVLRKKGRKQARTVSELLNRPASSATYSTVEKHHDLDVPLLSADSPRSNYATFDSPRDLAPRTPAPLPPPRGPRKNI